MSLATEHGHRVKPASTTAVRNTSGFDIRAGYVYAGLTIDSPGKHSECLVVSFNGTTSGHRDAFESAGRRDVAASCRRRTPPVLVWPGDSDAPILARYQLARQYS